MKRIFFDTEFNEDGKTIDLISIGMCFEVVNKGVRSGIHKFYAEVSNFDRASCNDFVKKNVIPKLKFDGVDDFVSKSKGFCADTTMKGTKEQIRDEVLAFCNDSEVGFYAYYSAYDWVVVCQLFGTMMDLPKNFPMYCVDLKYLLDDKVRNVWLKKSIEYTGDDSITFDLAMEKFKEIEDYSMMDGTIISGYPIQGECEHNSLDDALWNLKLFKFLKNMTFNENVNQHIVTDMLTSNWTLLNENTKGVLK